MLNEFRYACRALRRKPGFSLTAILSIALGIGANAAIFSFADGILLRPLPVPKSSEVVTLRSITPRGEFAGTSWRDFNDFRGASRSFNGLTAYQSTAFGFAADVNAQPQLKGGLLVSGNFFGVLGIEPWLGRGFRSDEGQVAGRDAVVVLSNDFWHTEFNEDASVVGRHVRLNGLDFVVAGVAPPSFTGLDPYSRPAFFIPATMGPALLASDRDLLTDRSARVFTVKGRLKRGVSLAAANAEAVALAGALEQTNPSTNRAIGAAVHTEIQTRLDLGPGSRTGIGPVVGLFSFLVFMVLAVACANVANLMLGRGRSRSREIAVRLAIGSSRVRLVCQLMAESLLIAVAGGALGLIIARSFVAFASASIQIPGDIPLLLSFQLGQRVLGFTALVSLASAILFGLVPALQSTRTDLVPALKSGEADQARRRILGRSALVVVQIAGSMVLLVLAMEVSRSFSRQLAQSPGFRRDHVLTMSFDPTMIRYSPAQTDQFYRVLIDRARAVSGVKSVALASTVPMSVNDQRTEMVIPQGYQFPRGEDHANIGASTVDENYFATLGVQILRGRGILRSDNASSPPVAVVNQAFARHYLGEAANPIGKRLRLARNGPWVEIIGLAATGKYYSSLEPPTDYLYLPFSQHPASAMTLFAHTRDDPAALAAPLRETVHSVEPNMPVFGVRTMSDFYEQRSVKVLDFISDTVAAMGLLGLGLALVGLYAVVAYQVAGRTREIGIRMAVGANRTRVVNMILRQAAAMSVTGVAIGAALSMLVARALRESVLTMAFDPLVFTLLASGLLLTTLLAAAIPARRASKIDPMLALRQE